MNREALRLLDELDHAVGHIYLGNNAARAAVSYGRSIKKLRALLSAQEPTGWRPIETAPKDTVRILLGSADAGGDGGISVCGYWTDELEDGVDFMGNDGGFVDVDYQVFWPGRSFGTESHQYKECQPTHWQPLPEPPGELAKQEGK